MEEENKVTVSEKEMETINNEITNVEQDKLNAAKEAGIKEGVAKANTANTIQILQAQLKATTDKMAEMERKVDEANKPQEVEKVEEPVVEVKEEVQEVKEERPQRRGVVPESTNPIQENVQTQPEVKESPADEWANFEASVRGSGFRASIKKEDI